MIKCSIYTKRKKKRIFTLAVINVQYIIVCVNKYRLICLLFISVHIVIHFIENCISHVNGTCKSDRGTESEIQAIFVNKKNWFFNCPGFGHFGINRNLLSANIDIEHKTVYSPFMSYRTRFSLIVSYIIEIRKKICSNVMLLYNT